MNPEYYYLLAISNRNFSINQIQPPFSKGRRLNTIPAEQLGAITKRFPKDIIQSDTKVIYIPTENSMFDNDIIDKDAVSFAFALNFYVDDPGIIIDRAYTFKKIRVLKCLNIHYVNGVTAPPGSTEAKIRLTQSAKPVDIESLCDQTRNALDKDKNMILTINK